jgi:hypothetical protein
LLLAGVLRAGATSEPGLPAEVVTAGGEQLSTLAATPDWSRLEPWQQAVSAEEWRQALTTRFAPNGAEEGLIEVTPEALYARMQSKGGDYYYGLVNRKAAEPRPVPPAGARYWRTRAEMGPATADQPLAGLRVALDPGHLGGAWAVMEERSFSVDGRPPVQEGDLTLHLALLLKPKLEALGANVTMVRDKPGPVTTDTPESLHALAETIYLARTKQPPPPGDAARELEIKKEAELLFYRVSEIQARGRRVNDVLKPDLVLCLHFNAVDWPDPKKPALVPQQHFHVMVNGAYAAAELRNDDERFEMVERIASGAADEELAAGTAMAEAAAPIIGLPAFKYAGSTAVPLGAGGYLWGRNLLANRLYECPVVYMEAYVMNSVEGYERIQAGEYSGTRDFGGKEHQNIFEEYAEAVTAGLVKYYGARGPAAEGSPTPAASPSANQTP